MGNDEFFATAAQVIPVLVLALFVEDRVVGQGRRQDRGTSFELLAVLALLLFAEYTAFFALVEERPSELQESMVLAALTVGFLWMLIAPLRTVLYGAAPVLAPIVYLGALVVLGGLAFFGAGADATPIAGLLFFLAAFGAATVVRVHSAQVAANQGAGASVEKGDDGNDDDDDVSPDESRNAQNAPN